VTLPCPFYYEVFGLRVCSDIHLAELPLLDRPSEWDVEIKCSSFERVEGEITANFAVTEAGAILNVPGSGRFLIVNGDRILVEPDPAGSERNMRLYLLGSAFGAIIHQRELLPLHANSIEINGKAVAFLGHSGAGKSTMAAWFNDRGYNVLADDVCVVKTAGETKPLAFPGIPRLRLWREALEASGRSAADYELSFDDMDKYNVPTREAAKARPLQLGAVYLLEKEASPDAGFSTSELRGIAALDAIMANTYRGAFVPMLDKSKQHLAASLAVASNVPVFEARRLWGHEHLQDQLSRLEQHAQNITSSS